MAQPEPKLISRHPGDDPAAVLAEADAKLRSHVVPGGPGFGVLLMDGDEPVLLKGYGNARVGDLGNEIREEEISADTVFDMASMSKQFTAMAILMLSDQSTRHGPDNGKYPPLMLNTPLSDFFPRISGAHKITITNLLNHSSGLPDYFTVEPFLSDYIRELNSVGFWYASMKGKPYYLTNEVVIGLIVQQRKLEFTPGSRYAYNNSGYVILAQIIEQFTGKSLREFLKEEIFDRLEMTSTFVYDETVKGFDGHALNYRRRRRHGDFVSIESDTDLNYIHGDGNVHSTLRDMMKWQIAWNRISELADYETRSPKALIKKGTFFEVFGPLTRCRQGLKYKPVARGYSAGLHIYRYTGHNVVDFALHHGGDWLGFHSYLMRAEVQLRGDNDPFWKSFSVVILSNDDQFANDQRVSAHEVARQLVEVYWRYWGLPARYNVLRYV